MVKLNLIFAVSLCVILSFAGKASAETLFFDDFEDGLDKWPAIPSIIEEVDPDNPNNHVLAFDTTADTANPDALFLEGYENLEDYTMRARFNIVGETASYAVAGLIVRASSAASYMLVEAAVNRQGVTGILNIFDSGAGWPILGDGEVDLEMNKWYELSVTVRGKNITASVDGNLIAEYDDLAYPAGGFGIREWMAKTLYDDVEVYDAGGSTMSVEARGKLSATWGSLKE